MMDMNKRIIKNINTILFGVLIFICTAMASGIQVKAAEMDAASACASVFDAKYYAKNNPDVVLQYGSDPNSLLMHYMQYGINEGRNASASFNATAYKNRYADLSAAYGNNMVEYCRHYANCGKKEGRNAKPGTVIPAAVTPEVPKLTYVASADATGYTKLGSYTTKYNAKIQRAINVNLAAARINGVVVNPGALFSYSNQILPRTPENGYVEAPIFINKQHGMGIGGGICQVSSTLYACMLTVGLPATERHPHSLPVTYLPEGMDATISGTTLDLKFVNIYDKPLMITASAENGNLTVSLWLKN